MPKLSLLSVFESVIAKRDSEGLRDFGMTMRKINSPGEKDSLAAPIPEIEEKEPVDYLSIKNRAKQNKD